MGFRAKRHPFGKSIGELRGVKEMFGRETADRQVFSPGAEAAEDTDLGFSVYMAPGLVTRLQE